MLGFLRLIPYALALVGTALALVVLWIVPSTATTSGTFEPIGEERQATMACGAGSTRSFEWTAVLEGPSEFVTPLLPISLGQRSHDAPAACTLYLTIRVLAAGTEVYRGSHGFASSEVAMGTGTSGFRATGFLFSRSDLEDWPRTDQLPVRIAVLATVVVDKPGTSEFEFSLGPLTVHHAPLDTDHDGVEDRSQVVPIHSGLATLLVAVVLTGLAVLWSKRWKKAGPPGP